MEYRYTSTEERVYADRALTVNQGDVVDWPDGPPADGHWEPTDETRAELDRREAEAAANAEQQQSGTGQTPPGMAGNPGLEVLRAAPAKDPELKPVADVVTGVLQTTADDAKPGEPTESVPGPEQSAAETTKE